MDEREPEWQDPAFQAVERVLTGAVSKVLSRYQIQKPSRCARGRKAPPTTVSSSDEDEFVGDTVSKKR